MMTHNELMQRAIDLAIENVRNGGGPFGAVIARNGEILAEGVNRVTANSDPTAHAEVQAIRAAAAQLGDFNLEGCDIYASCEPCPMCLGAIYWARLSHLFYAAIDSFVIVIAYRGAATLRYDGGSVSLREGESVLFPATNNHIEFCPEEGGFEALETFCC